MQMYRKLMCVMKGNWFSKPLIHKILRLLYCKNSYVVTANFITFFKFRNIFMFLLSLFRNENYLLVLQQW